MGACFLSGVVAIVSDKRRDAEETTFEAFEDEYWIERRERERARERKHVRKEREKRERDYSRDPWADKERKKRFWANLWVVVFMLVVASVALPCYCAYEARWIETVENLLPARQSERK